MRVKNTLSFLALWLVLMQLGCAAPLQSTYTTEPRLASLLSLSPRLIRFADIQGQVPLAEALVALVRAEVVGEYPPMSDSTLPVNVGSSARWVDVVKQVETATGWVYDESQYRFVEGFATHTIESPDEFGRPGGEQMRRSARSMVRLEFRFRRLSAGVSSDSSRVLNASGAVTWFSASLPDGVRGDWSTVDERGFTEGVQGVEGSSVVVNTTRRTVQSGIQFVALAARLPGGAFRMDGTLSVSSFQGNGLDRSVVNVPVQVDGPRYMWLPLFRINSGEAAVQAALKGRGLSFDAGASDVLVEVRCN